MSARYSSRMAKCRIIAQLRHSSNNPVDYKAGRVGIFLGNILCFIIQIF